MKTFLAIPAIAMLAAAPAPKEVAIPDTPAGRFVAAWLKAVNSADPAELERFAAQYDRKTPPQAWLDFHAAMGRMTPVRVTQSDPNEIFVLFAPEKGDAFWENRVAVDPKDPMKATMAMLRPGERPPEFALPRMPRAELKAAMDRKLIADAAADRFSGTLVVQRHGRIIYERAAGLADRAGKVPMTLDTKLRIGSANKMFTAVSILQLVEKGKISLDAPVGTYLRDYPNQAFAKAVTIRQLLSHTGGAGDIFTPEYKAKRLQVRTLADYVSLYGSRAQDTSEQGKGGYANYGFLLLGRIVEVVSGEDYYRYVDRHVFAPAGMKDTGSLPEETAVPGRSHGYMKPPGGTLTDNADTLPYRGTSAGGGYTTGRDLVRFGNALLSGKLISKATLAMATSPQRPDGWYGFGFFLGGKGASRNWGHGGGAPGMNASFRVFPELDAVVVALANMDPMAADTEADFYVNRMALKE